ncbi:FAD-binding domain-containing protein [Phellopilus nigrolimitatus]|nr:FAD-binding domain-containing protein [Phellopilus nigrolimitatus]
MLVLGIVVLDAFSKPIETEKGVSAANKACQSLEKTFPQLVSFPGSEQFADDVEHWTVSSEQNATCSIEPRSASDVSTIMQLIGRTDIRAPFAVKSGGHAYNFGHSSTPGVQISLSRLNDLVYDEAQGTVTIGMGLTWDQVYERLEPLGVMVAGGRINGVGVGGLSLGGGYSWKTNQYGLTIDTIVAHEVVLPSGQHVNTTNTSYPDLFFALKGGLNNFGIVTKITYEAHSQSLVYGGSLTYNLDVIDRVNSAVSNFSQNNTDPKAQMIVSYNAISNQFIATVFPFYDGPTPPAGIFDPFLAIPSEASDVTTRTFVDFMSTFGQGDLGIGSFGIAQHVIPVEQYTLSLLDEMVTQVIAFGARLTEQNNGSKVIVSVSPEPFLKPFSHSRGGAYPHSSSRQVTPASPFIAYQTDPDLPLASQAARHASFASEIKQFSYTIQARAVLEGLSRWDDILYPNYALADTPLELLYGSNLERCKMLAARYDPEKIMSLAGGFHFES